MLKLRFALCLALVVSLLTMIIGLLHSTRPLTILYRVGISFLVFGLCGYIVAKAADQFLHKLLEQINSKGQHVDIISEQQDEIVTSQENEISGEPQEEFVPLAPDQMEHISRSDN